MDFRQKLEFDRDELINAVNDARLQSKPQLLQRAAQALFSFGVLHGETDTVSLAIENGADANKMSIPHLLGEHPLGYMFCYHWGKHPDPDSGDDIKDRKYAKVVELICCEQLHFSQGEFGHPLDRILCDKQYTDAGFNLLVDVVLTHLAQQIERQESIYTIDIERCFVGTSSEKYRKEYMDSIHALHDRVLSRITNPENERDVFLSKHRAQLGGWAKPFERPDIDTLPRPTQEYINSVAALRNVAAELGEVHALVQAFDRQKRYSAQDADALSASLRLDAEFTQGRALDALHESLSVDADFALNQTREARIAMTPKTNPSPKKP